MITDPVFNVSDAVAVLNQSLEYAYPTITVVGELANFNISKNKWVYCDIKDELSKLRCFGTVYMLPGPLEEGMMLEIVAEPRIHPQFGFNLNIRSIRPVGEGSIKKAANLLQVKLEKEGLFSQERKRLVPHAPEKIGLITSEQSAGFADFIKILNARWQGVEIHLYDVQVQGVSAPELISNAIEQANQQADTVDVLVVIRGGGSADDLGAYSTEQVTRAVAGSRIPTLVAIGHETDVSLCEMAADMRASTPSNAAELLFPDRKSIKKQLVYEANSLAVTVLEQVSAKISNLKLASASFSNSLVNALESKAHDLQTARKLLSSMHPSTTLKRGYALIQDGGKLISSVSQVSAGANINITFKDGVANAEVKGIV